MADARQALAEALNTLESVRLIADDLARRVARGLAAQADLDDYKARKVGPAEVAYKVARDRAIKEALGQGDGEGDNEGGA